MKVGSGFSCVLTMATAFGKLEAVDYCQETFPYMSNVYRFTCTDEDAQSVGGDSNKALQAEEFCYFRALYFSLSLPKPDESIADFMTNLKKLIIHYEYEAEFQSTVLWHRFVCRLAHESIIKRILTKQNDLTFH